MFLSLFQGFQIHEGIIRGGETDRETYWSHFLQWYTDAPMAEIPDGYRWVYMKHTGSSNLSAEKAYSQPLVLPVKGISMVKLTVVLSGTHKDTNMRVVLSAKDASCYYSEFNGMYIYNFKRSLSYVFPVDQCNADTLLAYVWNGDTDSKVRIDALKAVAYTNK